MFFKNNNDFKGDHLDFGIVKRSLGEKEAFLIATTLPTMSCLYACSKLITDIVHLKVGDKLSIQTKNGGQSFGMFKDRSSFTLFWLRH